VALTPQRLVAYWCWAVCSFLLLVGIAGLFTERIGPLPTNRLHALGIDLGVGLIGFGFARFSAERTFVLLVGVGMIVLACLGFLPATQGYLYTKLHMNTAESIVQLIGGLVSLTLWSRSR
jgi:hypothetical protein